MKITIAGFKGTFGYMPTREEAEKYLKDGIFSNKESSKGENLSSQSQSKSVSKPPYDHRGVDKKAEEEAEKNRKFEKEENPKNEKLQEEYTIYPDKIFEALKKYSDEMAVLKAPSSNRIYTCHTPGIYNAELALEILLQKHPDRVFQLRGKILDTIPKDQWWSWHWNLVKILYEHKVFITEDEKKYLIKERDITTEEQFKLWGALDRDRTGDLILKVIADFDGWEWDHRTFSRAQSQIDCFPWRYSDLRNILNRMPQKYWGTEAHKTFLKKMILYEEPMTSQELDLLREKLELPSQEDIIKNGRWSKKQSMERSIVVNGVRMRKLLSNK